MIDKQRIYEILSQIPRGRVTTYKEVARLAGTRGYQAVGQIISANPNAPEVPCHRVVRSDGSLGGYAESAGGIPRKIELLTLEGVRVDAGKIADFERIRWHAG